MNDNTLEKLLRKAPPVRPPAGLLEQLQRDIELPGPTAQTSHPASRTTHAIGFRRWIPALGFALWFLGCIVVLGIQASQMAELREQHRAWEAAHAAAAQRALVAEAARAKAAAELSQLKKDLADVQRLRAELQELRAESAELVETRAQNEQLRAELKAQTALPPKPEEDFFAVVQERAARTRCVNSLKRLGLAALIWASKSISDVMPDQATLKAGLPAIGDDKHRFDDKIFVCPGDRATNYEILGHGAPIRLPELIYARCPVHNIFGLCDGSVQQINSSRTHMVKKDDWWILKER
jgi:hypothetical protein